MLTAREDGAPEANRSSSATRAGSRLRRSVAQEARGGPQIVLAAAAFASLGE